MGRERARGRDLAVGIGADRVGEDIKRIDGLEGDLVVGGSDAGRQRDAAEIKITLKAGVGRSPHGEQVAAGVVIAGDRVAAIAAEVRAGDKADSVLVERIAVGIQRARNNVHALHGVAGAEDDGSLDGDGAGRSDLFAGKSGEVSGGDRVDAIEGGDIVVAQDGGVGNALTAAGPANTAHGLHNGPAKRAAGLAAGQCVGIDLGEIKSEYAAEGALQLIVHHLKEIGVGGAETVEQDDARER